MLCFRFLYCSLIVAVSILQASADLLVFNDDGAWNWFQDERVVVSAGKLIIGSVAAGIHDPARSGAIEVVSYDIGSGEKVRFTLHQNATDQERVRWLNDHSAPAFVVGPDGRIVAMYSLHGTEEKFYYRISSRARDATSWEEERLFVPGAASRVTFPNLHLLQRENGGKGRIYNFFRGLAQPPMPSWAYSDDSGQTWVSGSTLVKGPSRPGALPYVKYATAGSDTVHIAYTDGHQNFQNGLYHVYYRDGRLFRSDGTRIRSLLEGLRIADEGSQVFQANAASIAWIIDLQVDGSGKPYLVYSVQKDSASLPARSRGDDHRYRYARWSGRWLDFEIAYAGSQIHLETDGDNCTGLVALDPQDPKVVYISTNADPVTGKPLVSRADHERHWEIFKGVMRDSGAKWTWTPLTHDSSMDNIRPIVPVWKGDRVAVLWLRGKMRLYTDYRFDIVGLISQRS